MSSRVRLEGTVSPARGSLWQRPVCGSGSPPGAGRLQSVCIWERGLSRRCRDFWLFHFLFPSSSEGGKSSQSVFVISKTCYNMPNINLCLPPFLKEKETLGASCCVQWLWPCEWSQEDLPKGAIYLASVNSGSVSERVGSERNLSSPEELIAADTLKRGKERK